MITIENLAIGPTENKTDDDQILIPSSETYWLHSATGQARTDKPTNSTGWEERSYFDALRQMFRLYSSGDIPV